MKRNKLLIYIVLFFCLFMAGVIKVKAADYTICHYQIPNSTLTSEPYKLKNVVDGISVYIYYRNNSFESFTMSPLKDNTLLYMSDGGSFANFGNYFANASKYSKISSGACPQNLTVNQYIKGKGIQMSIGTFKEPINVSLDSSKSKTFSYADKTCKYIDENNAFSAEDIVILYHSTDFFQNIENTNNKYEFYITYNGQRSSRFYLDDKMDDKGKVKKRSYRAALNDLFYNSNSGCPIYMYKKGNSINFSNYGNWNDDSYIKYKNDPSATKDTGLGDLIGGDTSSDGLEYGTADDLECEDIFGDKNDETSLMYVINKVFNWIRIAVPILLIVLGIADFSKVVANQDPDALKKATSKFSKRCVVAIIIFFLPSVIMLILKWIDQYIMSMDSNCVVGSLNIVLYNIFKIIK